MMWGLYAPSKTWDRELSPEKHDARALRAIEKMHACEQDASGRGHQQCLCIQTLMLQCCEKRRPILDCVWMRFGAYSQRVLTENLWTLRQLHTHQSHTSSVV